MSINNNKDHMTSALNQDEIQMYLKDIRKIKVMTPEREKELAEMISSEGITQTEIDNVSFLRPVFLGKLNAQVEANGGVPHFVSIQSGAFLADEVEPAVAPGVCKHLSVAIDSGLIAGRKMLDIVEQEGRALNLADANVIVAVGRGIKGPEHIEKAERLAHLLGGQVAASRAVCDEGWLPMERQIGSSGQTVAPRLYIALGISGAIQHLVGMKASGTVVAVNKDSTAPIFSVAHFGIVGDLQKVIPMMIKAIKQRA